MTSKTNNPFEQWMTLFESRYQARTGMTVADGGMSRDEVKSRYYNDGYTPEDAVTSEIERHDLIDVEKQAKYPWA